MTLLPAAGRTVVQIGNFTPPYSTENELRKALTFLGAAVHPVQEDSVGDWLEAPVEDADLILWTRTRSLLKRLPGYAQVGDGALLTRARLAGVPVIGYHLDIWFGLPRASEVTGDAPYFGDVDVMVTADGGHDDEWRQAGIEHVWMPPAVSAEWCTPGRARPDRYGDATVAFVGSWQGSYHPEAKHRHALIHAHTAGRYKVAFYPRKGEDAIRGRDLADLYATHPVVVGDSALLGPRYYSDRIPETLGRAGCLIHPHVEDVIPANEHQEGLFRPGHDLLTFAPFDFDLLDDLIVGWGVEYPEQARQVGRQGRARILEAHTYTHRMAAILELASTLRDDQ